MSMLTEAAKVHRGVKKSAPKKKGNRAVRQVTVRPLMGGKFSAATEYEPDPGDANEMYEPPESQQFDNHASMMAHVHKQTGGVDSAGDKVAPGATADSAGDTIKPGAAKDSRGDKLPK